MTTMSSTEWVTLDVSDGTRMRAFVARPPQNDHRAGLLLLQEAFGVNAHIRDVADRWAAEGYVVVAPELFHRHAPGFEGSWDEFPAAMAQIRNLTVEGMEADMTAAHAWLMAHVRLTAALGFCMGGRAAFVANSVLPLAASVSYYGGGIAPALLDRAPRLHGEQLFFWGGRDERLPPAQHRDVADALRAAGKAFADVEFSDADHGFFNDQTPRYHERSARRSWALARVFLGDHLLA